MRATRPVRAALLEQIRRRRRRACRAFAAWISSARAWWDRWNWHARACPRSFLLAGHLHLLDLPLQGIEAPITRRLARREFLQRHQELAREHLHRTEHVGAVDHPVMVGVRVFLSALEWIAPQIEEQGQSQVDEGLAPHLE